MTDGNTSLGQQIFDISMAQVETVVEPHRVTDDLRWKSMSFICIHPRIISSDDFTCRYPKMPYLISQQENLSSMVYAEYVPPIKPNPSKDAGAKARDFASSEKP